MSQKFDYPKGNLEVRYSEDKGNPLPQNSTIAKESNTNRRQGHLIVHVCGLIYTLLMLDR